MQENNLMGAAEWTGYGGTASSYSPYSPLQSTPSGYSYDTPTIPDHHSNFHLPTVIPDVAQSYCPPEYHHSSSSGALVHHQGATTGCAGPGYIPSAKAELDPTYSSYNNWSNGYNNYQYGGGCPPPPPPPPPQSQYPTHSGPTMVLYPQLYSTVNQNQIHLHLHGSDKIEQYFGPDNSFTISSISSGNRSSGIEIGIGTAESILPDENAEHQTLPDDVEAQDNREDNVVGDPSSVWRPY